MTRADAYVPSLADGEPADARLVWRLSLGAALLALEAIVFRAWLPAFSSAHAGTFEALLTETGSGTLRSFVVQFAVVAGMVSLLFGESQLGAARPRLVQLARSAFDWRAFVAHAVTVSVFVGLTTVLLGLRISTPAGIAFGALWLASAALAVGLLAVSFLTVDFWLLAGRSAAPVLTTSLGTAVGGYLFAHGAEALWQTLSHGTMAVAFTLVHPFVRDLTMDAPSFVIGTPAFQVRILAPCSGYAGLGLVFMFTSAWLWFHRASWRFPQALVLVPVGLAGVWLLNCFRVAALLLIGIYGSPDIALRGFHTQAGWVAFNVVALGICVAARRVPWFLRRPSESTHVGEWTNPTAPYLLPFLGLLAGSMAAQLASAGFEWLYGLRVLFGGAALCWFIPKYRSLSIRVSWRALLTGAIVFSIWIGLDRLVGGGAPARMPAALAAAPIFWRTAWIFTRAVGAVVVVPMAEELAFRGFLMRRFDSDDFESVSAGSVSWTAILLSSLAFGVMHGDRWIAGAFAGLLYALVYSRRGWIADAVAAHAFTNALLVTAVILAGQWQFW